MLAQQQIVHLKNAKDVLEAEIKQLKAQQVEGKTTGPHPSHQQTLRSLMTALSKAKLTLEKVEKLQAEKIEDAAPMVGAPVADEVVP